MNLINNLLFFDLVIFVYFKKEINLLLTLYPKDKLVKIFLCIFIICL